MPFASATMDAHQVVTVGRQFGGTLTREAIDDWLDHTTDLFGAALLRLKGILKVEGAAAPVVLHGVQGLVYSPGLATGDRSAIGGNRMVLIARGVDAGHLDDALARLADAAQPAA